MFDYGWFLKMDISEIKFVKTLKYYK
jgi:hypothetical protein